MLLTREELRDLGPGARTSSGTGLGNLGIVGVAAAIGSSVAQTGGAYFASEGVKAQAASAVEIAEAQATALAAPFRYEYKLGKRVVAAQRFQLAVDAVSGQTVRSTKDYSGAWIGAAIAAAVGVGFLIIRGV